MSASPAEIQRQILLLEPAIAAAFLVYVRESVGNAQVSVIERLIAQGRIEQIAAVLGLAPAALSDVVERIRTAYIRGGQFEVANLPTLRAPNGQRMLIQFDVRNSRAEAWLRNHSSQFVTRVTAEQIEAIRVAVTEGTIRGQNPRRTALDIAGRIGPSGRRSGGIVGLTSPQVRFVSNSDPNFPPGARQQLLSGDPDLMRKYFTRQLRDRRFDGIVRRAIASGQPVSMADVDRITARYSDRLLKLRGETIARTEALAAFSTARDEAMLQAIDTGAVNPQLVTKTWTTASDSRVRDAHSAMGGQKVAFDQPFRSPTGALLRHPGDSSLGAGAADIANCFAPWCPVDSSGIVGAIKSQYTGVLVELSVGGVVNLTVTANHPVLTQRGWVGAGEVQESDYLIHCGGGHDVPARVNPDVDDMEPRAQELYDAAKVLGGVRRADGRSVNFHGYVPDQDVEVVTVPCELRNASESARFKLVRDFTLADTDIGLGGLLFDRMRALSDLASATRANCGVGASGARFPLLRRHLSGRKSIAFRNVWGLLSKVAEACVYGCATNAKRLGNAKNWVALFMKDADRGQQMCPAFAGYSAGPFAAQNIHLGLAQRRNSDVLKTLQHESSGPADGSSDLNRREALGTESANLGVERDADFKAPGDTVLSATRVLRIRRSHYDGPVYSFESSNGIVVAGRIITHNCRCIAVNKVDYLQQGLG